MTLLPRLVVVEAAGADLGRHAVVIDLADAGHAVADACGRAGQRHDVGMVLAEVGGVLEDAGRIGPQAGHERRPAGIAQRKLAIGPVEEHAASWPAVDVRAILTSGWP